MSMWGDFFGPIGAAAGQLTHILEEKKMSGNKDSFEVALSEHVHENQFKRDMTFWEGACWAREFTLAEYAAELSPLGLFRQRVTRYYLFGFILIFKHAEEV